MSTQILIYAITELARKKRTRTGRRQCRAENPRPYSYSQGVPFPAHPQSANRSHTNRTTSWHPVTARVQPGLRPHRHRIHKASCTTTSATGSHCTEQPVKTTRMLLAEEPHRLILRDPKPDAGNVVNYANHVELRSEIQKKNIPVLKWLILAFRGANVVVERGRADVDLAIEFPLRVDKSADLYEPQPQDCARRKTNLPRYQSQPCGRGLLPGVEVSVESHAVVPGHSRI
ncbi:hypothetical protein DM02DRAFT_700343 [Periconia macrospinosa]|uniref:Uncharacterized protein n=1 Tax=Periconia macrospinosa TaxID=97972 RepID=A0A2V1D2M8_9PLEO|nr:hypothetical protein DM02DRAFT_700343 [Periconia macrospinosa]